MQYESLKSIDLTNQSLQDFSAGFSDCIVVNSNNKLVMQKRGDDWPSSPGKITTFGGKIESGETPELAIVRELNEELGATPKIEELTALGAVTEIETNHTEIVYCFFWKDTKNSITGCYEGESILFDNIMQIVEHPKTMDYVRWFMLECHKMGLI